MIANTTLAWHQAANKITCRTTKSKYWGFKNFPVQSAVKNWLIKTVWTDLEVNSSATATTSNGQTLCRCRLKRKYKCSSMLPKLVYNVKKKKEAHYNTEISQQQRRQAVPTSATAQSVPAVKALGPDGPIPFFVNDPTAPVPTAHRNCGPSGWHFGFICRSILGVVLISLQHHQLSLATHRAPTYTPARRHLRLSSIYPVHLLVLSSHGDDKDPAVLAVSCMCSGNMCSQLKEKVLNGTSAYYMLFSAA